MDIGTVMGFELEKIKKLFPHGISSELYEKDFHTPLMHAIWYNRLDVVNYLLDTGSPINERNTHSVTALMWAAKLNKSEIIEHLISKGADVNMRTFFEHGFKSSFDFALNEHSYGAAKTILLNGFKIKKHQLEKCLPDKIKDEFLTLFNSLKDKKLLEKQITTLDNTAPKSNKMKI